MLFLPTQPTPTPRTIRYEREGSRPARVAHESKPLCFNPSSPTFDLNSYHESKILCSDNIYEEANAVAGSMARLQHNGR